MAALVLNHIERGTITMVTADTSDPVTLAQTLLDTSKTMLFFSTRTTSAFPVDFQVIGRVLSTTQIQFERTGTPSTDIIIEYIVMEFVSGIYVQHMYFSLTTSPNNTTIADITLSKTFPILTLAQTGTAYGANDIIMAEITTTTNLQTTIGSLTTTPMSVQVVQIDDASVQKLTGSYGTGATADVTVTDITESLTFWLFTLYTTAGFNFQSLPYLGYVGTTTLRFTRAITAAGTNFTYMVYVVELSTGITVQNISTVIASSGTTVSPTISNVTVKDTALLINGVHQKSAMIDAANDDAGGNYLTLSNLTSTAFTATRAEAPALAATTNVQVINFMGYPTSIALIQE